MSYTHWDDLEAALSKIRDALDDADMTPFGKMEALLDNMTKNTDQAVAISKRLREMSTT